MKKTWTVLSIYWLIKLRWFAICFVVLTSLFAIHVLNITIAARNIYVLDLMLLVFNSFYLIFINRLDKFKSINFVKATNFLLNLQISLDYIILTLLIHFSGGIDNPFIIIYLFHMILAGIMLPFRQAFLQTTLALFLLGSMAYMEYNEIITHHCLQGFISHHHTFEGKYLVWTSLIFGLASYLILYMTNFITGNLRRFEKANRLANIELNRKDRIKSEFVSRLTHDIKGHIYAIQTLLSVVRSSILGKLEPKQEEFINRAYNRTKTLADFTKDLLNHTEMLMSKELQMENFLLKASVEKVIKTYENSAKWKSIDVKFIIDPTIDKINANQLSIEALLSNLLFNAIKYTPEKGSVSMIVKDKKRDVLIEISDTGIGIAEDDQAKIFQEFYRAQNAKNLYKDGTGMGLSIASQVTKIHSGKIWFESKMKEGTTFWVQLPKNMK